MTIGTFNERPTFSNLFVADTVQRAIQDVHSDGCELIIYAIMPDHVHLLVRAHEGYNIISVIKLFKQKTGYWHAQKYKRPLWQKSFYDHIVRDDEGVENVISYILNNPVRAGLVGDWKDYSFIGSGIWSRHELEKMFG
jgi:REP element-mobilizing transposase RayT